MPKSISYRRAQLFYFKKFFFYLAIVALTVSCETETKICDKGVPAKLYYTPDCATINGYIILNGSGEIFVFQHEISEEFQSSESDVCVEFKIETEPIVLTAECTQGDVIIITSIKRR